MAYELRLEVNIDVKSDLTPEQVREYINGILRQYTRMYINIQSVLIDKASNQK